MQYIEPVGAIGPANDFGHDYVDKNAGLGIAGSFLPADVPEHVQIEILNVIAAAGFTPSGANLKQLAYAIQKGMNYAVATGTANAWVVGPSLAPLAYAAGLPFDIVAPATNTSTTVNANVSSLGNKRIKKADGSDPAVGDVISGVLYPTRYDGTNIRIMVPLPSDVAATIKAQKAVFNVQSITNGTRATLTGPGDGATWRTMFSGSYVKQSATSNILWSLSIPLWAPGNTATRQRFLMGGGSAVEGVTQYSFGSNVNGHMTLSGVVPGLGAGSRAWSADLSRSNDAVSWSMVVNPSSTDSQFYTAAGTSSSVIIQEFEP